MVRALLLLIALGCLAAAAAPTETPIDVKFWSGGPGRNSYDTGLLKAALKATQGAYGEFNFTLVNRALGTNRGRRLLAEGDIINIYAAPRRPAHIAKYEHIIPVDFPILDGLLGYRRLIIPTRKKHLFAQINTVSDLAKFRAGQGRGWLDADILRYNNLPVEDSGSYEQLFDMLKRDRFDYVLLGAHEIGEALAFAQETHPDLMIVPELVVYYPFPVVYQVSKHHPGLAARLLTGLRQVKASGEMGQLFNDHFATTLKTLQNTRTLLVIGNPYVDKSSPISQPLLLSAHH